jgi:hypothetical protein
MSYIPSGTGAPIFERLCREHAAAGMAHPVYAQPNMARADQAVTPEAPAAPAASEMAATAVPAGQAASETVALETVALETVALETVAPEAAARSNGRAGNWSAPRIEQAEQADVLVRPGAHVDAYPEPTVPTEAAARTPVAPPAQRGSHAALPQRAARAPRERVA